MATSAASLAALPRIGPWIDNQPGEPGERLGAVFNPATGKHIAQVGLADAVCVSAAVDAAARAFPGWSQTPVLKRARVIFRLKELVEQHADELAGIVTREHGKVLADARGSVQRGLEVLEFAAGIPQLLKGEYSDQVGGGVDSYSLRQPLGVCVGITPFNFPAMVPMWMFPMAIACGNTFVLKPSEKVPSCSLRLAELAAEAGLPPGVLNVVHGDRQTVDVLLADPRVAAVSFVGSTPVARHVYQTAAGNGKRVQALGGAKNHLVVLSDADMEQAADALVGAAYGSAGERCMAVSVAVPVGAAAEPLRAALVERIQQIRVRPGTDPDADMGPLITAEHLARVRGYIEKGIGEGAELVVDGRQLHSEAGFFLGPSLFDHASAAMSIYREEIFGPVLTTVRAATFEQALKLVNGHEFGNGAAIFTRDGNAARAFSRGVQAGMVGINVPIPVPLAFHSFGGWKNSLFGDMHIYGPEGVRFYTRLKTVTSRWPDPFPGAADFNMPTMT